MLSVSLNPVLEEVGIFGIANSNTIIETNYITANSNTIIDTDYINVICGEITEVEVDEVVVVAVAAALYLHFAIA
ncbi:MAG: hypothetical protein KME30_20025 [Iphinoe sp. HA4291-MV1]|nr:hypothetical protein [Iphinoe sp. HA4291-MV1]